MEEDSVRASKISIQSSGAEADITSNILQIIDELESENVNIHTQSLRHLLDIVLDYTRNKELVLRYKLIPVLNKFAGIIDRSEQYVLSTTILHIIGVRNGSEDKTILAGAATESFIQIIHSNDEKISKSGSKALCELLEDVIEIRKSLLQNGFLHIVNHTLSVGTQEQTQSSSSSQTENSIPNHVKIGLLDVILKLVTTATGLEPLCILIPQLEEMKKNSNSDLMNKTRKILTLLSGEGINAQMQLKEESEQLQREKEDKQKLVDELKSKEEQLRIEHESNERLIQELKKKDDELIIIKQEKDKEKQDKERKEKEINTLKEEIVQLKKQEIEKISQSKIESKEVDLKIVKDISYTIDIINKDPECYQIIEIDGFGIVRDSHDIPVGNGPWDQQNKMHVAYYCGINGGGQVYHKEENIKGNVEFQNNQILRQELDFNKGTLIFFVDGIQQPVYISGINEKVRFFIHMFYETASCTILSLKQIAKPTSVHIANKKVIKW
ncbi:MAG: hypothetical protein EZS28_006125 [Streblomastix strix]|uniref:Uncharacterized protein n=1 Tax=Streblomastix strix TaxID=222440 RepID=A0A5J4WTG1_9EUKA|nr:MAG: hypothetical protein EZS28_006125 [Streblomastix strix]